MIISLHQFITTAGTLTSAKVSIHFSSIETLPPPPTPPTPPPLLHFWFSPVINENFPGSETETLGFPLDLWVFSETFDSRSFISTASRRFPFSRRKQPNKQDTLFVFTRRRKKKWSECLLLSGICLLANVFFCFYWVRVKGKRVSDGLREIKNARFSNDGTFFLAEQSSSEIMCCHIAARPKDKEEMLLNIYSRKWDKKKNNIMWSVRCR